MEWGGKVQICMYRTYRGIIIISDYNSCNISYTIVDKYFLALLLCERVSNINKISFHAYSLMYGILKATSSSSPIFLLAFYIDATYSCNSTCYFTRIIVHEVNLRRKRNEEGKKITFINLYFVSIDRNCQIHILCWYECP